MQRNGLKGKIFLRLTAMYMNLLFTFSTHKSSVGKNNNIEKSIYCIKYTSTTYQILQSYDFNQQQCCLESNK